VGGKPRDGVGVERRESIEDALVVISVGVIVEDLGLRIAKWRCSSASSASSRG
jgi:hypothetical protein